MRIVNLQVPPAQQDYLALLGTTLLVGFVEPTKTCLLTPTKNTTKGYGNFCDGAILEPLPTNGYEKGLKGPQHAEGGDFWALFSIGF